MNLWCPIKFSKQKVNIRSSWKTGENENGLYANNSLSIQFQNQMPLSKALSTKIGTNLKFSEHLRKTPKYTVAISDNNIKTSICQGRFTLYKFCLQLSHEIVAYNCDKLLKHAFKRLQLFCVVASCRVIFHVQLEVEQYCMVNSCKQKLYSVNRP